MYLTASDLVKRSASQILHLRSIRAEQEKAGLEPNLDFISENIMIGEQFQKQCTKSEFVEMCGIFRKDSTEIRFSVDEVRPQRASVQFVEHKWVKDHATAPLWYFHSALIQTAFYGAMGQFVEELNTSYFVKGPQHKLPLEKKVVSVLNFGGRAFRVSGDVPKILQFYMTKARLIARGDHKWAKEWDKEWKHKEWDWFKHHITYRREKSLDFTE